MKNHRKTRRVLFALSLLLWFLCLQPQSVLADDGLTIVAISADKTVASIGETITWTASVISEEGDVQYCFYVFRNGKITERGEYGADSSFRYTLDLNGTYTVRVYVKDGSGAIRELEGGAVEVAAPPVVISSVTADKDRMELGEAVTWTASVEGGKEGVQFCFYVFRNDKIVERGEYGADNSFRYVPDASGTYTVRVYAKGDSGDATDFLGGSVFVASAPVYLVSVESDRATSEVAEPVTWTAAADGGTEPLQFYFQILRDGEVVAHSKWSGNSYEFSAPEAGSYTVRVYVKDAAGSMNVLNGSNVTVKTPKHTGNARSVFLASAAILGLILIALLDSLSAFQNSKKS